MKLPSFIGWRPLVGDELTRAGDVFVRVGESSNNTKRTPETGDKLYGTSLNRYVSIYASSQWWVYRPTERKSIPRRIMMNKTFSKPLPLP